MKGRILVLGAAGRLGTVAAETFRDEGWQVKGLVRPGRSGENGRVWAGVIRRHSFDCSERSTKPRLCQEIFSKARGIFASGLAVRQKICAMALRGWARLWMSWPNDREF